MNEAEFVFTEVMGCSRELLYLNRHTRLTPEHGLSIARVLRRRTHGEPFQYIVGKVDFMGFVLKVTPSVFIPRPETEILAERALYHCRRFPSVMPRTQEGCCLDYGRSFERMKIVDIGTGSGALAIVLAHTLKQCRVIASDISREALQLARTNARLHGVERQISFVQGNCLDPFLGWEKNTIDLILFNPPYIPSGDLSSLQQEVLYEPRIALDGGRDGLSFYRYLASYAGRCLRKGGFLCVEMGYGQSPTIQDVFNDRGLWRIIEIVRDYNDIERVLVCERV